MNDGGAIFVAEVDKAYCQSTCGSIYVYHWAYTDTFSPLDDGSTIFVAEVEIALAQLLACLDVLDSVYDCPTGSRPRI